MSNSHKPLVWLHGEVKTPPLSAPGADRGRCTFEGCSSVSYLSLPQSRPLPTVGQQCQELRIVDAQSTWRIVYRLDADAVVILEVFSKKMQTTPKSVIEACQRRLREYDTLVGKKG